MESFKNLLSSIPDARSLLVPNKSLSSSTLTSLEALVDDCNEYLMTQGFNEDQIWAQISLITPKLIQKAQDTPIASQPQDSDSDLSEVIETSEESENSSQGISNKAEIDEKSEEHSEEGQEKDFFDYDEMKRFVDEGEMEHEDPGLEVSEESESEEADVSYQGFFKEDEISEEEPEKLFSYIDDRELDRIEKKMVNDKPWQMKGEISSKSRPKDSLLNEDLDFDLARKSAPQTQTKEVTDEIEEIIKQRILDMLYDDVQPKKPLEKTQTRTVAEDFLDYEKSRKSLAELYEDDFKKEVLHIPVNTETERAKKEITVVFRKLCYNLDLISSLHPVAKPVVQDLEVKNAKVPALALEEVLPYSVSKAQLSAPHEVFDKRNTVLKAPEELTQTDKNNARKRHKSTLRTRKKERIMKLMNKMAQDPKAQKFEYRKMIQEDKAKKELIERKKQPKTKFTRSSEFFKNFQELNKELKTVKKPNEIALSKKIKL